MVRAVLFDMDGLMFDTERLAQDAWLRAGREKGWPITQEVVSDIRGTNLAGSREIFRQRFGDAVDYDEARALRDGYVEARIRESGLPVKPGLYSLLRALRQKGIPAAVATSTSRETAYAYLELADVRQYFSALVFGDEVARSKPAPDIFLAAAEKLRTKPEHCMVLEDSPNGLRAARAAGCIPVMVPDLTPPTPELSRLCAAVADTLEDAVPLLEIL